MTDYERLMEEHRRINAEWMGMVGGLNDVALGEVYLGVSKETYLELKAMGGNAKARRRWRRRNVPNTQRRVPECRMCAAFRAGQMGERSYCAEHAADAVRAWNAMERIAGFETPLRGAP